MCIWGRIIGDVYSANSSLSLSAPFVSAASIAIEQDFPSPFVERLIRRQLFCSGESFVFGGGINQFHGRFIFTFSLKERIE